MYRYKFFVHSYIHSLIHISLYRPNRLSYKFEILGQ